SDRGPAGSVAGSRPPARTAGGGSSAGRAVVDVPAVVGLEVGEARRRLRALGLEVDVAAGRSGRRVRASSPAAGTPVERGTTVRLLLRGGGKGRDENGKGKGNGDGDG